jgi:hypothetical protein
MKWLSMAVIGLLITNLAIVSTILFKKEAPAPIPQRPLPPGAEPGVGPKNYIIEKLKFDAAQQEAYEKLIFNHRNSINQKEDEIKFLKNKLYATLSAKSLPAEKDSLIAAIQTVQQQIENIHYNHFADIKKICTPQQLPLYNELSKEFASFFMPPKRPPHHPQK